MNRVIKLRRNEVVNLDEYRKDHMAPVHEVIDILEKTPLDQPLPAKVTGNERLMSIASHPVAMFTAAVVLGFGLFHDGVH